MRTLFPLLALCVVSPGPPARAQNAEQPVAVVNGRRVTQREVDDTILPQLLPLMQQFYDVGAYASYEARVSFRGKSRAYRALALQLVHSHGCNITAAGKCNGVPSSSFVKGLVGARRIRGRPLGLGRDAAREVSRGDFPGCG